MHQSEHVRDDAKRLGECDVSCTFDILRSRTQVYGRLSGEWLTYI